MTTEESVEKKEMLISLLIRLKQMQMMTQLVVLARVRVDQIVLQGVGRKPWLTLSASLLPLAAFPLLSLLLLAALILFTLPLQQPHLLPLLLPHLRQ